MSKKVLIISTSPRKNSNSDILADEFAKGATEASAEVEKINLSQKSISFCRGCLACQKTKRCVIRDDAEAIIEKMRNSDVILFATPVYFYEMCGQMKTLLDRTNPIFASDYKFRDIYLIACAADSDKNAINGAVNGLGGWIVCFDKASLKASLAGVGVCDAGEVSKQKSLLRKAYEMGKNV